MSTLFNLAKPMPMLLAALSCLALALGGCGGSNNDPGGITIGLVIPYTGAKAQRGIDLERALLMSLDAINQAGGVDGKTLHLSIADTHSTTYDGLAAARALFARPDVVAVIGPEDGALGELLAPVAKANDRLLLEPSPTLSSVSLGIEQRTHWVRLNPSIATLARGIASQAIQRGEKKVLIAYVIDSFGTAFNDILVHELVAGHVAAFSTAVQIRDTASSATVLSALQAAGSEPYDGIVLAAYPGQAASIVNETYLQYERARLGQLHWYLANTVRGDEFINHVAGPYVEGAVGIASGTTDDARAFSEAFAKRWFGEKPTEDAYQYVDALNLLVLALQQAGAGSGNHVPADVLLAKIRGLTQATGQDVHWDGVAAALRGASEGQALRYQGLTGDLSLLPNDPQRANVTTSVWSIRDGQYIDN